MFGIFDALVEDVAIFAHGSLRAPACFGEVVCFHQCTLLEHGDDVRGDVSRALSGDVLARCLLIPCGMLSHVSCFLVARNLGAFPMLLSVNVILTTSRARLSWRRRKEPKDREIVLYTVIDKSGLRYSVLHALRAKGSWRRFAYPLLSMSQRRCCCSLSITLSQRVLFLAAIAVFGPNADRHRRELAFSCLGNAQDGVPRAS